MVFLCLSCNQTSTELDPEKNGKTKNTVNSTKQNKASKATLKNNTQTTNPNSKAKPNVKPKNNAKPKGNYYTRLKKALGLTDLQIKKLGAISKKYKTKLQNVPKTNKTLRKKISQNKQAEIKRLLGNDLFKKKLEFDKKK